MSMEKLKIMTQALDYFQRGLAILEAEDYDTGDIEGGVRNLVSDLKEMQIQPVSASDWLTSDHVTGLLERYRSERENESVRQSVNSGAMS